LKTYTTKEEALVDLNAWGLAKGYAFSTERSKAKKKDTPLKVTFACDRREPKAVEQPRKAKGEGHNKAGKGEGCKFLVMCNQSKDKTSWSLQYRGPYKDPKTGNITNYCEHSHEPSSGTRLEHAIQRAL
jgi:hypothetical protein